jgi:hypothetical protein
LLLISASPFKSSSSNKSSSKSILNRDMALSVVHREDVDSSTRGASTSSASCSNV